jgi:apolipoprotein N-acyltransferase
MRAGRLAGWLWGVGHFTLGLNWIATAFTYQAKMPSWLGGLAVFLLSLYLALFPAMAMAGAFCAGGRCRAWGFAGVDRDRSLRGWLFTGFPWNPLGVALLAVMRSRGWRYWRRGWAPMVCRGWWSFWGHSGRRAFAVVDGPAP